MLLNTIGVGVWIGNRTIYPESERWLFDPIFKNIPLFPLIIFPSEYIFIFLGVHKQDLPFLKTVSKCIKDIVY